MLLNDNLVKSIEEFKDLTNDLIDIESTIAQQTPGEIKYEFKNGYGLGYNLYNTESVAVQRFFISKGAIIENHIHEKENEILGVYWGEIQVTIKKKKYDLTPEEPNIIIPKNTKHICKAIEDSWMVAILIPSAREYPK